MPEALFLSPEDSVYSLRRKSCAALLQGAPLQPYQIVHEEYFYPGHFASALHDRAFLLRAAGQGLCDGALRCCALWDTQFSQGLLLHADGGTLLCACLPAISLQQAQQEREAARLLLDAARLCPEMPVLLQEPLPPGCYALCDLVRLLLS